MFQHFVSTKSPFSPRSKNRSFEICINQILNGTLVAGMGPNLIIKRLRLRWNSWQKLYSVKSLAVVAVYELHPRILDRKGGHESHWLPRGWMRRALNSWVFTSPRRRGDRRFLVRPITLALGLLSLHAQIYMNLLWTWLLVRYFLDKRPLKLVTSGPFCSSLKCPQCLRSFWPRMQSLCSLCSSTSISRLLKAWLPPVPRYSSSFRTSHWGRPFCPLFVGVENNSFSTVDTSFIGWRLVCQDST